MTVVLETARLRLRWFTVDDAPFILELLNDPDFIRCIGDRGVRTMDQARQYIEDRLRASYAAHGFGLYAVLRTNDDTIVGMCGLIKRDELEDVDLGYALLPEHRGQGYARESGGAVLALARDTFGLGRVVAILRAENAGSIRVLEHLGMKRERTVQLQPDAPELLLYGCALSASRPPTAGADAAPLMK